MEWLEKRGLKLLERNYRAGHKEIDLIMESDRRIHFVEVKSAVETEGFEPYEKVDARKQKLLASAAGRYIGCHHIEKECQFDVVSIKFRSGSSYTLEYIPEAFIPLYYGI